MDDKSITALIERLLDGNEEVSYRLKKKLLDALNPNYYPVIWAYEDMDRVVTDLEDDGYKVDRNYISYAMTAMIENHHTGYGITWDTLIEYALEYCCMRDEE